MIICNDHVGWFMIALPHFEKCNQKLPLAIELGQKLAVQTYFKIQHNLKVRFFRKQILKFSFEPEIERKYFFTSALGLQNGSNQKRMQIVISYDK